ncbi:adenylosuccinate synthetase [Methanosarcina sp. DH1]|uniref:adenylosuccinate synthetase n=1 Tax=Methanosarcina sp. DH1 TaxID=2605695 RepID=UPI0021073B35|nr:adenylosuccinate synthetase [Methanosarcina sp. DH1]
MRRSHRYNDQTLSVFPETKILDQVEAEYETLLGWGCTTTEVDNFEDLPKNAKGYKKDLRV